jgi:cell wall-associated NlpC family hydrolase
MAAPDKTAGSHSTATGQDASQPLSTAKPRTAAEARKQLTAMNNRVEIVTEQYNGAVIDLAKRKAEATKARTDLVRLNKDITSLRGKVKGVAVSAYQNGHLASFSSFISSKSPQSFLDQLGTLDVIAKKQSTTLTGLAVAQKGAKKANADATTAEAAAKATKTKLDGQKRTILKQVSQLKTLTASLSAKELKAYRDLQGSINRQKVARQIQLQKQKQQNQPVQQPSDSPSDAPSQSPTAPPSQDPGPVSGGSSKGAIAVQAAEAELGKPYVWGAAGPDSFDCSGLIVWAWAKAGVSLPHQSAQQYATGTHVAESDLQPGDIVAYYSPIHHVAMYVGNGMVIQAPDTGDVVKYSPVDSMPYTGATRVG